MLVKIVKALKKAKKVAIFTHLNPDGDALGSAFSMKYVLEAIGKEAVVYLEKPMPEKFNFLGNDYVIGDETTKSDADTALVVDCGAFDRLGTLQNTCKSIPRLLCIDHHFSGAPFGDVCYKDAESAATAQMVYKVSTKLTKQLPLLACEAMYTGLSTDTGHFKFSNVSPETLKIAGELVARGVNHRNITRVLYDTVSLGKLIFMGKAAEKIEFFNDGKIGVLKAPMDFLKEYGLVYDDVEELPNLAMRLKDVYVSVLVKDKENDENAKRVSLRGKDCIDLSRVAEEFGGGGHKNAAACVMDGDIDQKLKQLIDILTDNLGEANV